MSRRSTRLVADRSRLMLVLGAALTCLALFAVGFALAPGAAGDDGGPQPAAVPAVAVRPQQPAPPLPLGTVRSLGRLPVLTAPRPRPRPRPRPSRPPRRTIAPPPVAPPPFAPPLAPPPVAPPPPAPPPGPPTCIGAGCDYG